MTIGVLVVFATCIFVGIGLTWWAGLSMDVEERFFAGWTLGIVAFTAVGIVVTRLFGVSGTSVGLTCLVAAGLSSIGWRRGLAEWSDDLADFRRRLTLPLRSGQNPAVLVAMLLPLWLIIGRVFWLAYQPTDDGGLLSGHLASWSDWQAHLGYTASFAYADNTSLDLLHATGNDIGYHSGINYFAALLVHAGASLPASLQLSSAFALLAFPGVMYTVGRRVLNSQAVAVLGTLLFLFFGGWGFLRFFDDLSAGDGLGATLAALPNTYTRMPDAAGNYVVMENPIVGHFFPQRPTVIGFPIVLLVLGWLWSAWNRIDPPEPTDTVDGSDVDAHLGGRRTILFCGVIVGLTPFFNLFAFGTPLVFVLCWWAFTRWNTDWLWFLVPAIVLALPVVLFLQPPSSTLEVPYDWVGHILHPGGIPDDRSIFTLVGEWLGFWARNMGLFLPLLIAAMAVPGVLHRRLAIGLLPVWLFFIGPNLVKPHPWNGNNTHYFIFLLLLGALPVAALIIKGVRMLPPLVVVAVPVLATMTFAGALDVIAANDPTTSPYPTTAMDGAAVAVGEWARTTETDSVFVLETNLSSLHLHPVPALSGRDVVVSFSGWVFDLGIPDWGARSEHSRLILEASPGWEDLVAQYGVDYLVTGPTERTPAWDPNTAFWEAEATVVYRHAGWTVYEL